MSGKCGETGEEVGELKTLRTTGGCSSAHQNLGLDKEGALDGFTVHGSP